MGFDLSGVPTQQVMCPSPRGVLPSARRVGMRVRDLLQLVPFLAFSQTPSTLTCPTRSSHLETVAWVVEQFLPSQVEFSDSRPARVQVTPARAGGPH